LTNNNNEEDYPNEVKEIIDFLQNFEILYKGRQKLTNEVMSLADRIITEYSVIKRHIKSNDEVRREVARRILELVEEDLE
jgi:hemerythrin-like domain-containing protein